MVVNIPALEGRPAGQKVVSVARIVVSRTYIVARDPELVFACWPCNLLYYDWHVMSDCWLCYVYVRVLVLGGCSSQTFTAKDCSCISIQI